MSVGNETETCIRNPSWS